MRPALKRRLRGWKKGGREKSNTLKSELSDSNPKVRMFRENGGPNAQNPF